MAEPLAGLDELPASAPAGPRRRSRAAAEQGDYRADRAAGAGDPRHAPRAPHRPRAREARRRVRRAVRRPSTASRRSCSRRRASCSAVIIDELSEIKRAVRRRRRTEIVDAEGEIPIEELIDEEDMVVTISHARLHQAHAVARVPRAEARRPRHHRRVDQGRRLRRRDVRRLDARPRAPLHATGPRLRQEGLRAARGRAHVARQGARQRARAARTARRSSRCCRSSSSRTGTFVVHGDARRRGQEDRARRVREHPPSGHHRAHDRRGRRARRRRVSPTASTTCCWPRATGCAIRFPEEQVRADGPHRARRAGHRAARRRRGRRLRDLPARRAGHAHHRVRARLRQAHRARRVPGQEPRRQGRHHHQDHRAQRQGRRRAASSPTTRT